jgi:hypothetical protein
MSCARSATTRPRTRPSLPGSPQGGSVASSLCTAAHPPYIITDLAAAAHKVSPPPRQPFPHAVLDGGASSLRESVPLLLKRQCDRTLGLHRGDARDLGRGGRGGRRATGRAGARPRAGVVCAAPGPAVCIPFRPRRPWIASGREAPTGSRLNAPLRSGSATL